MTAIGHNDRTGTIVEQIRLRNARDTHEVVVREEKLPEEYKDRLRSLEEKCLAFASFGAAFDSLSSRVKALEEKPQVVAPSNDAVAVPAAFGELVAKVATIQERISDVEVAMSALAQRPENELIQEINADIADLSATSLKFFNRILTETEELRRRANKSDNEILNTKSELRNDIFRDLREALHEEKMLQSA